jgi:hypothetical protein
MSTTKEKQRLQNKKAYEKHKEKRKKEAREYYWKNKDKVLENVQKYRKENEDVIKAKGKEYYRRKIENRLLNAARHRAKQKDIEFNIEVQDILIPSVCPLLNIPVFVNEGKGKPKPNSPSLDRIDPTKGYVKGNVWVISLKANTIKSNATLDELQMLTDNFRDFLNKRDTL